jgi:hypothetical protein
MRVVYVGSPTGAILLFLGLLALGTTACEPEGESAAPVTVHSLNQFPSFGEIGAEESGEAEALLFRVQDAAFVDGLVAVVDGAPPWIRIFEADGTFRGSLLPQGEGPGEAGQPRALSRTSSGALSVTEGPRAQVVTRDGVAQGTISLPGHLLRWAGELCGREHALWTFPLGQEDPPNLLVLASGDAPDTDTILTWGAARGAWSGREPPHVVPSSEGLLLHTEELEGERILELDCLGEIRREIPLEPLGPPERYEDLPGGGFGLLPAEPPLPGGLARAGAHVIWATRELRPGPEAALDSVTVVGIHLENGEERRTELSGWYLLHDGDVQGRLLWSAGYPVARVILVDVDDLMEVATRP